MEKKTVSITMDAENLMKIFELRGLINGAFYACVEQHTQLSDIMEHIVECYDTYIAKPLEKQILEAVKVSDE